MAVSELTDQGVYLRDLYMRKYREATNKPHYGKGTIARWDGGQDRTGVRHQPVWDKIADKLLDNGVDMEPFIEFAFTVKNIQYPTQLAEQALIDSYGHRSKYVEPPVYWDREEQTLITHVRTHVLSGKDLQRSIKLALNMKHSGISPLVCYCFAKANNCVAMLEILKPAAEKEFSRRKHYYLANFKEKIPAELLPNDA